MNRDGFSSVKDLSGRRYEERFEKFLHGRISDVVHGKFIPLRDRLCRRRDKSASDGRSVFL